MIALWRQIPQKTIKIWGIGIYYTSDGGTTNRNDPEGHAPDILVSSTPAYEEGNIQRGIKPSTHHE